MNRLTGFEQFDTWELEAFAEGVDMPALGAAIQKNPESWQHWLKGYEQETRQYATLYRAPCPSPDTLRDYFWKHLPDDSNTAVTSHLRDCPTCNAELQELVDHFTPAPAKQTASSIVPQFRLRDAVDSVIDSVREQVRIVVATLAAPLQGTPILASFRGDDTPVDNRRPTTLLFHAEETDVTLVVQRGAYGKLFLSGQLLRDTLENDEETVGKVKLVPKTPAVESLQSPLDDILRFSFDSVPPAEYQLVFLMPEETIMIPSLLLQ